MQTTSALPITHRTVRTRAATSRSLRIGACLAALVLAYGAFCPLAHGATDPSLERLATCQDSWLEWKDAGAQRTQYVRYVESRLASQDGGQTFTPRAALALFGMPVLQVYPQSVGMGVGFSTVVDADLPTARRIFEQQLGRPMTCTKSDGVESCELPLGEQKTVMLMTNVRPGKPTLAGCYYYYEK